MLLETLSQLSSQFNLVKTTLCYHVIIIDHSSSKLNQQVIY
jgi:hypothetical protein